MRGRISAPVQPMPDGSMPCAWSRTDLRGGSAGVDTNGTATTFAVPHDLGVTPAQVVPGLTVSNTYTIACTGRTATTLTFTIKNSQTGAAPATGQHITFDWIMLQ